MFLIHPDSKNHAITLPWDIWRLLEGQSLFTTMLLCAAGLGAPCWGMRLGAGASLQEHRAHGRELHPSPPCPARGPAWPSCTAGCHPLPHPLPAFPFDVFFSLKDSTVNPSLENEKKQTGTFGGAPSAKDKAGCCQGHRHEDIHLHSSPSPYSLSRRELSRFRLHAFKG